MTARRPLLLLPALLAAPLLAARCGGAPPPPAVVELSLDAGPDQNPGPDGRPGPLAVRLYQLKAASAFERADWYALAERERATLGEDGAGTEEVVLTPGETRAVTLRLKPDVRFVGATAAFREIDRAGWRAVRPVAASGHTTLVLRTAGTDMTLAPARPI